jgi:LysM repeat protein
MAFRNVQVDIEDAIFQTALNRATVEGKSIGQVIADFLRQYAQGATAGAPTSYTVQRGDTLSKIALKMYGDARKYPLLQQANNLSDPGRIWVGQVLVVPPAGDTVTPALPVATPVIEPRPTVPPSPAPPPTPPPPPAPAPVVPPVTPGVGLPPPRPSIRWVGSPNFNRRLRPDDITAITIHSTANSTLQGVIDWFNNPNAQVSAHYTIDKDGTIVQHVNDSDRAWHAGQSVWKGRQSCNDYCLGIELVNLNDGQDPYPEQQHQANVALCAYLCFTYTISPGDIMGHLDIALPPGRKSDPKGYDLERLRREVAAILGG